MRLCKEFTLVHCGAQGPGGVEECQRPVSWQKAWHSSLNSSSMFQHVPATGDERIEQQDPGRYRRCQGGSKRNRWKQKPSETTDRRQIDQIHWSYVPVRPWPSVSQRSWNRLRADLTASILTPWVSMNFVENVFGKRWNKCVWID